MRGLQGLGIVFLLLAVAVGFLLWQALPLSRSVPLSDTQVWPQLLLTLYLGVLLPMLSAFTIMFGAWLPDRTPSRTARLLLIARLLRFFAVLSLLGFVALQIFAPVDPYGPSHQLLPGVFQGVMLLVSALVLLPATVLVWVMLQRLGVWVQSCAAWTQEQEGRRLQDSFRRVRSLLLMLAAPLLLLGLSLVPVLIIAWPEPMSILTPAQQLMVRQQQSLTFLVTASAVSVALGLWFIRKEAEELTHRLNPQHSRISRVLAVNQSHTELL